MTSQFTCIILASAPLPHYISQDLFSSLCSLVVLFFCGHVESNGVPACLARLSPYLLRSCPSAHVHCSSSGTAQYLLRKLRHTYAWHTCTRRPCRRWDLCGTAAAWTARRLECGSCKSVFPNIGRPARGWRRPYNRSSSRRSDSGQCACVRSSLTSLWWRHRRHTSRWTSPTGSRTEADRLIQQNTIGKSLFEYRSKGIPWFE